jgi:hypothetical protein
MKVTKEKHVAEYILLDPSEQRLQDYDTVRTASGGITAGYKCAASLVTAAGEPGSLVPQSDCEVKFETTRFVIWDLPVPVADDTADLDTLESCDFNACSFNAAAATPLCCYYPGTYL